MNAVAGDEAKIGALVKQDVLSREEALQWAAKARRRLPLSTGGPRVRAQPGRG
jgi:hypothetical protein